jgi:hypothetical protein
MAFMPALNISYSTSLEYYIIASVKILQRITQGSSFFLEAFCDISLKIPLSVSSPTPSIGTPSILVIWVVTHPITSRGQRYRTSEIK